MPAAAAADPDDFVCVHLRRRALGTGRRGGCRDAPIARYGGIRRHARRDLVRDLPHARLLLRDPMVREPDAGGDASRGCAPITAARDEFGARGTWGAPRIDGDRPVTSVPVPT